METFDCERVAANRPRRRVKPQMDRLKPQGTDQHESGVIMPITQVIRRFQWRRPTLQLMVGLSVYGAMSLAPALVIAQSREIPIAQPAALPQTVQQGYRLLERGWVDDAIKVFTEAVQRYPHSIDAQLGLAIAYRQAGQDEAAFESYQQVITLDPANRLALTALGVFGTYRPEWQSSGIEALTTLLDLEPNNWEARSQRALLLFYRGNTQSAIADYQQVLATNNSSPTVWVGAAQVYAYGGLYPQAIDLFQRYLRQGTPLTVYEAIAYAFALRQTENFAAAVMVLEPRLNDASVDHSPEQIALRGAMASAYAANGQASAARAVLTPLYNQPNARLTLARALNDVGRYSQNEALTQEAIILYKQVLEGPELTVGVAREIADVLSNYPSEQATALALYQQLYQQHPHDLSLYAQQSIWERQLAIISATELRRRLQPLTQQLPTDRSQLGYLAQGLIRLDPPDPGLLTLYEDLAEQSIEVPFLHFRLAQLYLQRHQLAAARTALRRYADSPAADEATLFLLLAELERQEGNVASSEQRYQQLIIEHRDTPDILTGALQGLAGIRQGQGRTEEALALYDQVMVLTPEDEAKPLGRAAIAYQGERLPKATAMALVHQWLTQQPATHTPSELFSLVSSLPPEPALTQLYGMLLEVNPDSFQIRQRQIQAIAMTDPDTARALAAEVVAEHPDAIESYLLQGQIAQDLTDLDMASQAYQTILRGTPNQVDALAALGGVRFQQRRYGEAQQLYDLALTLAPNNLNLRRAAISLTVAQDHPITALRELEALQVDLAASGYPNYGLALQRRQLQEFFLLQRGFQPVWERY
jgi:tetratricopeptide (TPR) repeat protein